jgi:uncharacterized protein YkwD
VQLTPAAGPTGTAILAVGTGFPSNQLIGLSLNGILLGYTMASSAGQFTVALIVPAFAPGSYPFTALPAGSSVPAQATFTIQGSAGPTPTPISPAPPPTATPTPISPAPPPTATPAAPTGGGCTVTAEDQQTESYLYGLLNQDRASNGVGLINLDSGLSNVARAHSCDLYQHDGQSWPGWPHFGSDSSSPFSRMANGGYGMPPYRTEGENVGWSQGYPSAQAAAQAIDAQMMAEPPGQENHRANILNSAFSIVGVGIIVQNGWVWITEDFAG